MTKEPGFRIGQFIRPDGTVLAEHLSSDTSAGPVLPDPPPPWEEPVRGEVYGRWRYQEDREWKVIAYWPDGPGSLPAYADHTGQGLFHSMDPGNPDMPRDAIARQLRVVRLRDDR